MSDTAFIAIYIAGLAILFLILVKNIANRAKQNKQKQQKCDSK